MGEIAKGMFLGFMAFTFPMMIYVMNTGGLQ
jgi:hypothetical protein